MSEPVAADAASAFRRLCRSSPWRWESLRFAVTWQGPERTSGSPASAAPDGSGGPARPGPEGAAGSPGDGRAGFPLERVMAWLRRPDALRVERPDGRLLYSTTGINNSRDAFYVAGTRASWLLPPRLVQPVYDDAGLVRRRPEARYGDPAFGDGLWAAMLDPVELAGNAPAPTELPFSNVVEIHELRGGTEDGRAVWEAVVSPNASYHAAVPDQPLLGAGRSLVRIDAQTSVCTHVRRLEGQDAGAGRTITLLGVDEYMLDDLFVEHESVLTDVRDHIPWIVGG
ncbi:hypothetical protein [Zhihengliuella sp.]|uniref:hypothetical protein n=1 Tax=Zhihengliuella sp. TaxID=1954483 RepID=UPI00281118C3|nr:hypothetical protein [Zhihengliuella sp.]